MADTKDISFDDLVPSKQKAAPTTSKVEDVSFDDLLPKKIKTTALGTAGRAGAEVAATVPGSMYAAGVGTEIGTASMPFVAAIPYAGPFIAPFMPAIGGVTGGLVASVAQSYGINSLEQLVDNVFGTNIQETKSAQSKEHPYVEKAAQVTGMVIGPGGALVKAKDLFTKEGAKTAAVGSGMMVGIGGTSRAIEGKDVLDPTEIATDVLAGAIVRPSKFGEKLIEKGKATVSGKSATVGSSRSSDMPPPPPESASPEQKAEIGRRRVGKECLRLCRSRWSPYH